MRLCCRIVARPPSPSGSVFLHSFSSRVPFIVRFFHHSSILWFLYLICVLHLQVSGNWVRGFGLNSMNSKFILSRVKVTEGISLDFLNFVKRNPVYQPFTVSVLICGSSLSRFLSRICGCSVTLLIYSTMYVSRTVLPTMPSPPTKETIKVVIMKSCLGRTWPGSSLSDTVITRSPSPLRESGGYT